MGAQHSAHRGGPIKLRRRAATMGITTSSELQNAGVDIEHAVKVVEAQIASEKAKRDGLTDDEARAAAVAAATSSPGIRGATGGSPRPGSSPGTPPRGAGGLGRLHPSAAAMHVEMPPWEIVASLGEGEWLAFRSWLQEGWRCKKCGCSRDDHGDHPKAVRLLCSCGVPVPGYKGPVNPISNPRGFSPASSPSRGTPSTGMFGYASESPDHQVGYLSDQSCRSTSSSRGASPMHQAVGGGPRQPGHESPRFANDMEGGKLSFPAMQADLEERLQLQRQREEHRVQQEEGGYCPHPHPGGGGAPRAAASGPMEPRQVSHPEEESIGVEGCPHLASLGLAPPQLPGRSGSFKERQSQSQSQSQSHGQSQSESFVVPEMLRKQGEEIHVKDKILRAVTRANQIYFVDKEPNGTLVFDFLLSALLDITNSPYGWISSALLKADGTPYIKTHAMSNICWNKELKAWYAANAHKGLVFTNLNTLHGSIVYSGQPVISNSAQRDPRARGVPGGHPPIDKFFGIPLFTGSELIGIYGVADSPDGYTEELMHLLEPLTLTIAQMMYAVNERKRRREAELQLSSIVQVAREGIMSMSQSGQITSINTAAREMFGLLPRGSGQPVVDPELASSAPPCNLNMHDMVPEIDGRSQYLRRGLEPQAGHKHTGFGRRADRSTFPLELSITKGSYGTTFYVAVIKDLSELAELQQRVDSCTCGGTRDVAVPADVAPLANPNFGGYAMEDGEHHDDLGSEHIADVTATVAAMTAAAAAAADAETAALAKVFPPTLEGEATAIPAAADAADPADES